jgi:hypothetical protein
MKVLGIGLVVLALFAAILPMFTDCQSQGKAIELANGKTVPMKCHWTGIGELALAVPLIGLGAIMTVGRRKETLRSLSIVGVLLGIMVILLPARLIGVCSNPDMLCKSVMQPALIFAGVLMVAAGVLGLLMSRRELATVRADE